MTYRIITGDALEALRTLEAGSVQCCVTSPPYWGLRDYGVPGQLGLESTPEEYVSRLVEIFREVRRVLADDGVLWCVLGDCYANDAKWGGYSGGVMAKGLHGRTGVGRGRRHTGLKPKDLCGIPWRVAFALQADGWWLRADNIWHKTNPVPSSAKDRTTRAHDYIFHFAKSATYYYDGDAIQEPAVCGDHPRKGNRVPRGWDTGPGNHRGLAGNYPTAREDSHETWTHRNRRTVWSVATQPYPEAHFATFPEKLIEPCVLAGSRQDDTVLDPFCGSGTTGVVALRYGRRFLGVELNPEYVLMAERRIAESTRQRRLDMP